MLAKLFSSSASDANALGETSFDVATLYAVSQVANLLLPDSCPNYTTVEHKTDFKNDPSVGIAYLGKVPSSAKTVYNLKEQRRVDLVALNARTQARIENVEKFIVASLVTGGISPTLGLDFANCSLVDTPSSAWLYRHTIDANNRYFYDDPVQLRQVLVRAALETRTQNLRADWQAMLTQLKLVIEQLHQQVLILSTKEIGAAKKDKTHLFNRNDQQGIVAKLHGVQKGIQVEEVEEKFSTLSLQPSANSSQSNYSAAAQFNIAIQRFAQQIGVFERVLAQEQLIETLARNSKAPKLIEDRNLQELLTEYWNDPSLKVRLSNGSEQDFVLWCHEQNIQWEEREPILTAYKKGRKINGIDPLLYAIEKDISIERRAPVAWVFSKTKSFSPAEIESNNAITWLAENRPATKIEGMDIISFSVARGIKLEPYVGRRELAIDWLARNRKITKWQGKDKYEWIIEKWLKDPSIRIQGVSPVVWCMNQPVPIGGIKATDWLKAQAPDSRVFEMLIRANIQNHEAEQFFFHESIRVEEDGVSTSSNSASTLSLINDDSIVWLIKNLSIDKGERVVVLLQKILEREPALQDESSHSTLGMVTHVGWLREKRGFDLLGYLREKRGVNFDISGKRPKDWLEENKSRLDLSQADREELDYVKGINEKYAKFWGRKLKEDSDETEVATYKDACQGDFWMALDALKIYELELIKVLIAEIGMNDELQYVPPKTPIRTQEGNLVQYSPMKVFAPYGHNINGINPTSGRTPLHWGSRNIGITKLLIGSYAADPNVRDVHGATPAHYVASNGALALLQYLVLHEADLAVKDNKGQSVFQTAVVDHIPRGLGGRDRLEVIQYMMGLGLQLKEYHKQIFRKAPVLRDELLSTDSQGKTPVEIAETKGSFDVVELFRTTMANRVNTAVSSFLKILYQPSEINPKATIPLIISHPEEAFKLATECATTLNNYLPYLMGSVFNSGVQAFNIIRWHNKDFPNGKVLDKDTGQPVIGAIAKAGEAVQKVFKIIEEHGVVSQNPKNFQLAASSSLSSRRGEDRAERIRRVLAISELSDSDEEVGASIMPASSSIVRRSLPDDDPDEKYPSLSSSPSLMEPLRRERRYTTALASEDEARVLLIVPQEVIKQYRGCTHEFFSGIITRFQTKDNDQAPAKEAKILESLLRGKLQSMFQADIHQGMDNCIHSLFLEFIKQLQKDLQADANIDEGKYKTLKSYKDLQHIQELLTGVQIQWGDNQGWCKKLEAERIANQDRPGYGEMVVSGFRRLIGRGSTSQQQTGNAV
jgi:Ankyrin repeats (many copies)